ncbi:MAG: sortase [Oscillochloridaceae bacterium]|nr:sortase [Chloroflexaceae bacterium]MDW8392382.1 sortase [Oscillochloridaceae bacterium]
MRSTPRAPGNDAGPDDDDLLLELLVSELPSREDQIRPARLRSASQQQRIALSGFRLRNWVDRGLMVLERALVVAALIAFGYWLFDGPVRDFLHIRMNPGASRAQAMAPLPTPPLVVPTAAGQSASAPLPFTRPEDSRLDPSARGAPRDAFLAPQAVPAAGPLSDDPRPQRLVMPGIGADMPVREIFVVDGEWEVAEYAAGYHNGSALPGTIGNTVLSGHAGLRGAVFRDIGRLRPGDEVIVETGSWRYVYRVRETLQVWPTQVEVMAPTSTPVLTLITCTNWDTQRLVVVADLADARPRS